MTRYKLFAELLNIGDSQQYNPARLAVQTFSRYNFESEEMTVRNWSRAGAPIMKPHGRQASN